MIPCDKSDDIREIRSDVKEMKELLNTHIVNYTKLEAEVSLFKKIAGGLGSILVGVLTFLAQKKL